MPTLRTMEYLGRLGLVPRRNKKDRVASLPHVAGSNETRRCMAAESAGGDRSCKPRLSIDTALCPLETGTKCAIKERNSLTAQFETALTQQASGFVEIRGTSLTELPRPAPVDVDIADSFFPRTSTSGQEAFIDIEFMEYQQHVQAQAQALGNDNFGAPGGRHAWKTLIFWKRRRTIRATSTGRPFVSAAGSTPLHHPTIQTVPGRKSYHGSRRAFNAAMVPLYMSDEFSTSSIRAWWEPIVRGGSGKLSMAGDQDAEFCNMSPYVPLGGRPQRLPATAPLYLV